MGVSESAYFRLILVRTRRAREGRGVPLVSVRFLELLRPLRGASPSRV